MISPKDQIMEVIGFCGPEEGGAGITGNPLPAVYLVAAFVLAAALLLFSQMLCGQLRRRTNNFVIHGGLWLGYTLLPPLITYTLGMMHSSTVDVVLYPVWALFLLLLAGGTNTITAYDLDDNKQWRRHVIEVLQCDIYFCIILFRLLYPKEEDDYLVFPYYYGAQRPYYTYIMGVSVILLLIAVFVNPIFGVIASWMVSYSDPSKVVADYMKDYVKSANGDYLRSRRGDGSSSEHLSSYFSPANAMKGCKYLVRWPYMVTRASSRYFSINRWEVPQPQPQPQDGVSARTRYFRIKRLEVPQPQVITVEMIWDKCNDDYPLTPHGVNSSRLRGACLAYSLSHLLMRRFFGMECAEASLLVTRQFVLQGLLSESNTGEYTEAFKIIEVELGFLYDFFYTKYGMIFGMEGLFFSAVIAKIICSFAVGVLLVLAHTPHDCNKNYIIVTPGMISVIITVIIIVAFLAVEAHQFIQYLGSDWAMVSLACCYITGKSGGFIPLGFRKRFGFLLSTRRRLLFRHWQKKLGQYSVVEGSRFFRSRKDFAFESNNSLTKFLMSKFIAHLLNSLCNIFASNRVHFVKLPDTMKPQIVSLLKSSNGHLTNGEISLRRNQVFEELSWTLQHETQTENMLIWHIATDYCRITSCGVEDLEHVRSSPQVGTVDHLSIDQYRELATKISCYCAYLISNAPELLPGNSVDTRFVFDQAMYQAREALGSKTRTMEKLQNHIKKGKEMQEAAVDRTTTDNVFAKGLHLGVELENMQDGGWKVMAEFWIETILYIAPSDNAKAHMEHLAHGGQFLTHLWALLTHAGILTRDQEPPAGDGIA